MKITSSIWAKALHGALKSNPQRSAVIVRNFIKKLTAKRQTKLLPAILRQIKKIETNNTINVSTAFAPPRETQKAVEQLAKKIFLDAKNASFIYTLDKNLIGGVKIKFQDQEFDASASAKIANIKEQLCHRV